MSSEPALSICPARLFVFYSASKMETVPDSNAVQPPLIQPQAKAKPTSITVFGILNIVFSAFGLLCAPFSMVIVFGMPNELDLSASYKIWIIVSFVIGYACSIWQLVLGIGLLNLKRWARGGCVAYGFVAIAMGVVNMIASAVSVLGGPMQLKPEALPGLVGGMIGGLIGMAYPIVLIIFMRKANVRAAFNYE